MLSEDRRPFVYETLPKPARPVVDMCGCKSAGGASELSATQREGFPLSDVDNPAARLSCGTGYGHARRLKPDSYDGVLTVPFADG